MKNLNSGGNKSGKRKLDYEIDKYEGDFPLLEVVMAIVLIIAYILWKN